MAFKTFELSDGQAITIYKRRKSRSLRLSIAPGGEVRVSIPLWAPYKAGVIFAQSRSSWIDEQRVPTAYFTNGQTIGKAHHLYFRVRAGITKPSSRITTSEVVVNRPLAESIESPSVQKVAESAAIRALRKQASVLLPPRLAQLAAVHGHSYSGVQIKQLKGRWGSCDQKSNITLNLFLMQLPWELIDYVLLHELTHTKHLNHSPDFWTDLVTICPNSQKHRKELHKHKPIVFRPESI